MRKRVAAIRTILRNASLKSSKERLAAFKDATGQSSWTYWTTLKLMRERKVSQRLRQLKRKKHKQTTIKRAVEDTKLAMPLDDPVYDDRASPQRNERTIEIHGMKLRLSAEDVSIEFEHQQLVTMNPNETCVELPETWLKQVGLSAGDSVSLVWNYDTGELVIKKAK